MSPRLRRLTGSLLIGVFFATFAASISSGHLDGQDDALCVVPAGGKGPAVITSKSQTEPPDHCAVCHWVRAVAGAASYGPSSALAIVVERAAVGPVSSSSTDSTFSQSSPRAPPVSSLS
jgi:hypothetical protein